MFNKLFSCQAVELLLQQQTSTPLIFVKKYFLNPFKIMIRRPEEKNITLRKSYDKSYLIILT